MAGMYGEGRGPVFIGMVGITRLMWILRDIWAFFTLLERKNGNILLGMSGLSV
jgi:hypothetical protein